MQYIPLLEAATQHLECALSATRDGRFEEARESFSKGITLIEFVNGTGSPISSRVEACRVLMLEIISKLSTTSCTSVVSPGASFHSRVSDDDVPNLQDNIDEFEICEEVVHPLGGTYADVVGCCQAKRSLVENVILPFTCLPTDGSHIFHGIRSGTGNVLLHGPPGTGKTMLAQATAREAHAVFYCVHPSDVLSKYQGESERYLKEVFRRARGQPRAIIFFDEFDSLAAARGSGDDSSAQSRRLLSELLVQMTLNKQLQQHQRKSTQGTHTNSTAMSQPAAAVVTPVKASLSAYLDDEATTHHSDSGRTPHYPQCNTQGQVVVLAATNRLEDLDEAVLRRFETKVYVGLPDLPARLDMLRKHLQGIDCALSQQDLDAVGSMTAGWSGSDIEILCREAAMAPVREVLPYESFLTTTNTATVAATATVGVKRKAGSTAATSTSSNSTSGTGNVARDTGGGEPGCGNYDWGCLQNIHVRTVQLQDFVTAHENLLRTGEESTQTI